MVYCKRCGKAISSGILCGPCSQSADPQSEQGPILDPPANSDIPSDTGGRDETAEGCHCDYCNSVCGTQLDEQSGITNTPADQASIYIYKLTPIQDNKITFSSPHSNSIIPQHGIYVPKDLLNAILTHHLASNLKVTITGNSTTWNMTYNQERMQCDFCKKWFPSKAQRKEHRSAGWCSEHKTCCSYNSLYYHAMKHRHSRCFGRGCTSKYRGSGHWGREAIKQHIASTHNPPFADWKLMGVVISRKGSRSGGLCQRCVIPRTGWAEIQIGVSRDHGIGSRSGAKLAPAFS